MPKIKQNRFATLLKKQHAFILAGNNRSLSQRREALRKLFNAVDHAQEDILTSLAQDLGKPPMEAFTSELLMIRQEIRFALKKLRRWMRPKRVPTPLIHKPGISRVYQEPFGSVLIIAPWNYPCQLLLAPLISALAAGNSAVIKPSELAPATARAITRMIKNAFRPEQVAVVNGGIPETTELLANPFDMIFYTGNATVGKIVMRTAAEHLTPVVLELGGKSPCIVDKTANIPVAARRIAWGKFFNAGQTCVAPDYLYLHKEIKKEFLQELHAAINEFYGSDPEQSPDYARIVNSRHFERLTGLLPPSVDKKQTSNKRTRYLAPVVVEEASWKDPLMQGEIFGPILPVMEYSDLRKAIKEITARPKPLALYLFSTDRMAQKRVLAETSSGGVCINDTIRHLSTVHLPFGGVGESGMGTYHGQAGFCSFSHEKSVMKRGFFPDFRLAYPPYRLTIRLLKRISRLFL